MGDDRASRPRKQAVDEMTLHRHEPELMKPTGIFAGRVFQVECRKTDTGSVLVELVRNKLGIEYPLHEIVVDDLKQDDGHYATDLEAATAPGTEIRYLSSVSTLFRSQHFDESLRVHFRVQISLEEKIPCVTSPVASTATHQMSTSGKRPRVFSDEPDSFDSNWVSITRDMFEHLQGEEQKMKTIRAVIQDGESHPFMSSEFGPPPRKKQKKSLQKLLEKVSNHRDAWPFREPVDIVKYNDYLAFVKEPIDLQTISQRIKFGEYANVAGLKADLVKMCENCKTYNPKTTRYYSAAAGLLKYIEGLM